MLQAPFSQNLPELLRSGDTLAFKEGTSKRVPLKGSGHEKHASILEIHFSVSKCKAIFVSRISASTSFIICGSGRLTGIILC